MVLVFGIVIAFKTDMRFVLKHPVYLFLLLLTPLANAAFEKAMTGAKPLALSYTCVAASTDLYALYYNPANLSRVDSYRLAATYRNFYGLRGLGQYTLVSGFNLHDHPLVAGVDWFGNRFYTEFRIALGSAYHLVDTASIGLTVEYYHLSIKGYGQDYSLGLHLGVRYQLTDILKIGAMATNLNSPVIGMNKERLPQVTNVGFGYSPHSAVILTMEIESEAGYAPQLRCGLSYDVLKSFAVRMGFNTGTDNYSFGVGLAFKQFQFDYGGQINQIIGFSQVISIQLLI